VSLQGSLRDFGAPDVFQLIAQQRKTGVLEIKGSGRALEICFREGRVVRAYPAGTRPDEALAGLLLRIGALPEPALSAARNAQQQTLEPLGQILEGAGAISRGELEEAVHILTHETIFELFQWDDGAFKFRPESVREAIGDEELGADQVLLDAVRMTDEWARIAPELPDLSAIPSPTVDLETFRSKRASVEGTLNTSGESLERLFMMADGRRSARRVIDLSRLGTFDGARGLVALSRSGLLRFEAPERSKWKRSPAPEQRVESPTLLVAGSGLVTLVIAFAVSVLLWLTPAPHHTALSLPVDVLASARVAADGERIRTALEAERWVLGNYPSSLEALNSEELASLALPLGDGYIYERISGGYRLFRTYP
jgi:hypothetical protein